MSENNVIKNNDSDSKKIVTLVVLILTVMFCTTGATYAYLALTISNNVASGTVASASLSLTVTQATLKSTNTGVMVPQLESAIGTAMNGTNQCVDGNGNIVCKVYTITVTNNSTATVQVNGTIQFSGNGSMPNLKWRRATAATTLGTNTTGSYAGVAVGINTTNAYDLTAGTACTISSGSGCTNVSLTKGGGSATYYIVVWINETKAVQTDTGTWRGTIKFEGEDGTGVTSTIK